MPGEGHEGKRPIPCWTTASSDYTPGPDLGPANGQALAAFPSSPWRANELLGTIGQATKAQYRDPGASRSCGLVWRALAISTADRSCWPQEPIQDRSFHHVHFAGWQLGADLTSCAAQLRQR